MAHLSNIDGLEMEGKLPEVRLATTPLKVVSPYEPSGDQPQAIEKLARGVEDGLRYQTLLGVTGSGKTFTMAKTIEAVQKPTLVMAPNKTLAAQLASELKRVLPEQLRGVLRVVLRLLPARGLRALDRHVHREGLLHQRGSREAAPCGHDRPCSRGATASWWPRCRCIYGIGYARWTTCRHGGVRGQAEGDGPRRRHPRAHRHAVRPQRLRAQARHVPRARRQRWTCSRPMRSNPLRIEFWGDEIERIAEVDNVTGEVVERVRGAAHLARVALRGHAPEDGPRARHHRATSCDERLQQFKEEGKLLEAQRLEHAHELRPGDAGDDGLLLRHRELLAPHRRALAGRAALHAHRLLPERLPLHHRRDAT